MPLPPHQLDHWARAFRGARLGWVHHLRRHVLPGAVAVASPGALLAAPRRVAFLDRDVRHPSLYHLDVGGWHPAGVDVAGLRLPRLPRIFLSWGGAGPSTHFIS